MTPFRSALEAEAPGGHADVASGILDEALWKSRARGENCFEAEPVRRRGVLFRDQAAAETLFLEAIHIARGRQAKLGKLRGASSLARLWAEAAASRPRSSEAREREPRSSANSDCVCPSSSIEYWRTSIGWKRTSMASGHRFASYNSTSASSTLSESDDRRESHLESDRQHLLGKEILTANPDSSGSRGRITR
jgi:hypothetical protein